MQKKKDVNGIQSECDKCLKMLDNLEKYVTETDGSQIGSVVFSFFTSWTITFWKDFLIYLALGIPTFGLANWVVKIKNSIQRWGRPISKLVNSSYVSLDDVNLYKNKVLSIIKYSKEKIKTLKIKLMRKANS